MTQHAMITNTRTGQKAKFSLPFPIRQLSKIGVDENFEGELYVDGEDDTFGFGVDGYLTVEELWEYLIDYENRQNPYHFDYMMLSRLQQDCNYFLGYGNRYEEHLWAGNVAGQITEMKRIWRKFPEDSKPEWLTWEGILDYERRMTEHS
jgi:hypothetical protein